MPANGEMTTVITNPSVPVDISLNLLKREMALGGIVQYILINLDLAHSPS